MADLLRLTSSGVEGDKDFVPVHGQRDVDCNMFEVEENLLDSIHISVAHSWGNPDDFPIYIHQVKGRQRQLLLL